MRRNLMARIFGGAAALVLLVSSAAAGQFDEEVPVLFDGVRTAILFNELNDPTINAMIDATARDAHEAIGGIVSSGKKNTYFPTTLPDSQSVVRASLDVAKLKNNLVIITGGDSQSTVSFVRNYQDTTFLDVGQPLPCVDADGRPDRTGVCDGTPEALPPNYSAIDFEVEDPAYLAGVIAAAASRDDRLGIISGRAACTECNRYIQGFTQGARSVKPEIQIDLAYLADESEADAFGDPATARTFASAFIDVYQPDVLLAVGRGASTGMIEAACEAGILAVGTDIDVAAVHPDLADCVLASITKDVEYAVRRAMYDYTAGATVRQARMTLADGHVDLTDEWTRRLGLPVDVTDRYENARNAIITDQVDTCPQDCGAPIDQARDEGQAGANGGEAGAAG